MSIFRKEEEESSSTGQFLLGALIGAAAGLATHFLLNSRTYQNVRRDLVSKCHDLSDSAEEFVEEHLEPKKTKRKTKH